MSAEHFQLLSAIGGYVSTISGDLPHATLDVSVY